MKLQEVIQIIEHVAPREFAASWDNCGVQVASLREDIGCVALCLDPTPASIGAALELGAELIVSHHPLLMQGRLPAKLDAYHHVLRLLFARDATLYAAHTSLDVNGKGPVGWLARALDLQDTEVVEPVGMHVDGHELGFGLVGNLPEAVPYAALLAQLEKYTTLSTASLCGPSQETVRRVAYCTGSGSGLVDAAAAKGAEIFITGDVKYHAALESPIAMLDVGHHSLEEEMMRQYTEVLAARLSGVRTIFVPSASPLRPAHTV